MTPEAIKPSRWYYLLSLLVAGIGVAIFVFILFRGLSGIPEKLTQMEAPGSAEMTLSEPGSYTIFYERRSVFGGKVYDTGAGLSGLICNVVSKRTGEAVPVTATSGRTNYTIGERAGTSVLEFNIERPGVYEVSAYYSGGGPSVVLAVGQGVTARIVYTVIGGLASLFGSLAIAIAIAAVTFVKRRRAKRALTWEGSSTNYPPAFVPR